MRKNSRFIGSIKCTASCEFDSTIPHDPAIDHQVYHRKNTLRTLFSKVDTINVFSEIYLKKLYLKK
jgi:hypothetical protein